MQNRFGLKDLLLVALMIVVIIVQFLQMKQRDLQQGRIDAIAKNIEAQNTQIANLIRTINSTSFSPGQPTTMTASTQNAQGDPFKYVREAEAMPGYARGDWLVDNTGAK